MLDQALGWDGEGKQPPVPWAWMISRVCQEFGVTPPVGKRLLLDDPDRMAMKIIRLRDYAAAWLDVKRHGVDATHSLVGLVLEVKNAKRERRRNS